MEKIIIGDFQQGLTTNKLPFFIDNDSFPTLYNFYVWRGRAKRKRGTIPLGRLQIQLSSVSAGILTFTGSPQTYNLFSNIIAFGSTTIASDQPAANFLPGNIYPLVITSTISPNTQILTDDTGNGNFVVSGTGPITSASINYANGSLIITYTGNPGPSTMSITGSYYPSLPVIGLEDYTTISLPATVSTAVAYPQLLAFDTRYSYQNFSATELGTTAFFNTNYFKNPSVNAIIYPGYVPKSTQTPFVWTGKDYQQFWTTNFEQALWATNGNPGMQIQAITTITYVSSTSMTFSVASSPAVIGDFVFVNEIINSSDSPPTSFTNANSINGQTGYVSAIGGGTVTVIFPNAAIINAGTYSQGIIQYLTNVVPNGSSPSMGDGIKLYDGDPTTYTGLPSNSPSGWINFNPPLSAGSQVINNYSSLTPANINNPYIPFYLVGCKTIIAYKDRMVFFGAFITTSFNALSGIPPIYLQDTALWSWNGSPYYTCSFASPVNTKTNFVSMITPGSTVVNAQPEGASIQSYYTDQTGFGGYLPASVNQPIVTVGLNEDVVMCAFTTRQTRFAYTSNDLDPFRFYGINSELGASATFSAITLDRGVITFGTYGFAMTTQNSAQRIDLQIPDQAFQIESSNYGVNRISSARDFFKEWVYFSYPPENQPSTCAFPTQTFLFNYRDNTWGIFYENFTCHGSFWRYATLTWATLPYTNWTQWNDPWNSPGDQDLFPNVCAGNPQGFVIIKGQNTGEAPTGTIQNAVAYTTPLPYQTTITSINHCVQLGDYLQFSGVIGPVNLNAQIGQVVGVTDINTFTVDVVFAWAISDITQDVNAIVTVNTDPYVTHNFIAGQSITITGVSGMTQVNGNTYTILSVTPDTFTLNVNSTGFSTYINGGIASPQLYSGLGVYTRLIQPFMQSKQFPTGWGLGRQTRIGTQQYLLDKTPNGQVTLNMYLSMDPDTVWNSGPIYPNPNAHNNSLIYSQLIYTCPESTNLGLTPANMNLQTPTASSQYQIWHRMNTSLIGDTVQFGISLSDAQMRDPDSVFAEITLHAATFDAYPGPLLS